MKIESKPIDYMISLATLVLCVGIPMLQADELPSLKSQSKDLQTISSKLFEKTIGLGFETVAYKSTRGTVPGKSTKSFGVIIPVPSWITDDRSGITFRMIFEKLHHKPDDQQKFRG